MPHLPVSALRALSSSPAPLAHVVNCKVTVTTKVPTMLQPHHHTTVPIAHACTDTSNPASDTNPARQSGRRSLHYFGPSLEPPGASLATLGRVGGVPHPSGTRRYRIPVDSTGTPVAGYSKPR